MTRGPTAGELPAALLFDMDGLLVDTEGTWYVVESEVMAELGGPWDEEHQLALFGGPLEQSARYMLGLVDRPDVSEAWVARALVDGMVRHLGSGPVAWRPGAQELVTAAAGVGVPCALVSSSLRRVVDAVLDVKPVQPSDLMEPPELFRGIAGEYLKGLTRRQEQLVVVLDVESLLASQAPLRFQPDVPRA